MPRIFSVMFEPSIADTISLFRIHYGLAKEMYSCEGIVCAKLCTKVQARMAAFKN